MLERTALFAESWNVAWRRKSTGSILSDRDTPFIIIKNSVRYWAADPFLFEHNGEIFIFAELYDYIECRGGLGYCKIVDGKTTAWKKVIEERYHLSYPFIFENENGIYIMPESGGDKSLYLYKAVCFPDVWEKDAVFRENVVFGDTTPFNMNGIKYALTYDVSGAEHYDLKLLDLNANSEEDVLIPCNDCKQRRPAGKFFDLDGQLMRPAQICEKDYGEGLVFYNCRFENGHFDEVKNTSILPEQLHLSKRIVLDGMHTYNSTANYEVIDLKTRRFNLINLLFRFISKIKR